MTLTGKALCSLMRQHKVTIRELARRMALPLRTIRKRRLVGLTMPVMLDWVEAIRGHLTEEERVALQVWSERRWPEQQS
jgi:hypothetical protein